MNTIKTTGPSAFRGEPEDFSVELASEYGAHLSILDHRLEEALQATGFDGAVIFAGDERPVFRDDQSYPFRVEPYFKAWVPLIKAGPHSGGPRGNGDWGARSELD